MPEIEIIRHPQIDGMRLFFDTVDYRTPHVHPEWELLWVLDGDLSVTCGQKNYLVAPGQMALLTPNQPHEFCKGKKSCTFLCLQVAPYRFPVTERLFVDSVYPENYLMPQEYQWVKESMLAAMRTYLERPDYYELFCVGQTSLLLHRLLTRMPVRRMTAEEASDLEKRNARLVRLIEFVDQNYMHKIRLSDFARMENRSMSYLSHFVRETMNQSFQDYVNTVRFHCACKLIAAGGHKMLDVCMESGFSDYRYFSKTFQQRVGMTPEAYSRQPRSPVQDETKIHHSLHSLERFYSLEKSLDLLCQFEAQYQ